MQIGTLMRSASFSIAYDPVLEDAHRLFGDYNNSQVRGGA